MQEIEDNEEYIEENEDLFLDNYELSFEKDIKNIVDKSSNPDIPGNKIPNTKEIQINKHVRVLSYGEIVQSVYENEFEVNINENNETSIQCAFKEAN